MDFSEKWGKDVDEAVRLALLELKLTIDEVDVIVLEESSKGFFGLGSKLAKVRVEKKKESGIKKADKEPQKVDKEYRKKESPDREPQNREAREIKEPAKKEQVKNEYSNTAEKEERADRQREKADRAEKPEKPERSRRREIPETERPDDLVETTDHPALNFVKEIAEKMGLDIEVKAAKNDDSIYIDVEGKDAGTVIGKRGQTLDSVQYLTSLVANKEKEKEKEKYLRVIVDAENYRNKREKTLELLADRLAAKVVRTKKGVRLEPMNPYERKVIHARLQGDQKVTTRSEGEEPYRRVIIELK